MIKEANYINGAWVPVQGAGLAVIDPATGDGLGRVPDCGEAGARAAVEAAHNAFSTWARRTAAERAGLLLKLADLVRRQADPLAELLTREQGKPLAEARGEILSGANYIQWFAEEARRIYGDVIPSPWPERRLLVLKQPVGVVGAITPWNFPSAMIARKLGAALAAGCTIVIKPSELTPFSGLAWGEMCEEAGIPAGVVNIVTGTPQPIGHVFCTDARVAKITFTGSTAVGAQLASKATAHMKRVSMELGGNAPLIVFDDADLERAVSAAIASKFRNAGQTCVCTNRIYVQSKIYDAFATAFTAAVKQLKVGNGFEAGVSIGPLINEKAVEKVRRHIADAVQHGAHIMAGGAGAHNQGELFFQPTVLREATQDMLVAREETFGPVAPLFRFETEDEVVAAANTTAYGLACYVFTRDLARSFRMAEKLHYGQVGVNAGVITTEVAPFGGVKQSGFGREGSKYGIDDYIDVKYVCLGLE